MVAEVGDSPEEDQIYRITFDGSVAEEHGYVAMGGQADQVATVLKEHYAEDLSLPMRCRPPSRRCPASRTASGRKSPRPSWRSRCWSATGCTASSAGWRGRAWKAC